MKPFVCLLYTALHITFGCIISEPLNETIITRSGGAVLLLCSCTDLQTKPERIQWSWTHKKRYLEIIGEWTEVEQKRYGGRVQTFSAISPGNASLLLSDLTEEDQGEYTCLIFTSHSTSERSITLIVDENPNTTELPSMPFFIRLSLVLLFLMVGATAVICSSCRGCNIFEPAHETITRSVGCAMFLPCSCTELQLKPNRFLWTFNNNKSYLEIVGIWNEIERKHYSGRIMTFSASAPGNASLLLSDLTEEDQGEYTCLIFTNYSTSDRSITLIVDVSGSSCGSGRVSWSRMILILVLLVMLGAFAVLYWRNRKRRAHDPVKNRQESSEQKQPQNLEVIYSVIDRACKTRSSPRDANTEMTMDATYATVNKARLPHK